MRLLFSHEPPHMDMAENQKNRRRYPSSDSFIFLNVLFKDFVFCRNNLFKNTSALDRIILNLLY